ncbi:MAG: AsmA-like C-terminal region-containing protein, partial [Burkholderiales bacterium]
AGPAPGDRLRISLGPSVSAEFERRREGARYVVKRGVIGLNEPAVLPDREGISLIGNLPYVDADRWRALLGGVGDAGPSLSSSLRLKVGVLDFAGRRLNDVDLRAGSSGDVWIANLSARELAGEIAWRPEGSGRIVARLKHFSMPEAIEGRKEETPPRELPALDIIAEKLLLNGSDLGRLELVAVNKALDWEIEKLVLTGPESTLRAGGKWQNWAQQPSVSLDDIVLEVEDVGKYLDRVGFPGTVRSGAATLKGSLKWSGNPQSIDYASLSGNLELNVEKGQFLKADPGAAKLIGILSMQSWVTLDFRELFNRGFTFDSVSCNARIENGVLKTDNFRMKGPSAAVAMSGQTDLARETQDLNARVEPAVGNSLSVILAVVINPVWGLGSLLLQEILKNPLAQAFAFEYHVTGSWTEPKAERLKLDVQTSDASQERP